jgi:hypothetical protein
MDLVLVPPRYLFRLLPDEHARTFVRGSIRLSTLEGCRRDEKSGRGDPGEGRTTYNTGSISGDSDDPSVQHRLRRITVNLVGSNIALEDNTYVRVIPDAYLLCMTTENGEDLRKIFGERCIRIRNPIEFFSGITEELRRAILPYRLATWRFDRVAYSSRFSSGDDPDPGDPGFIKPIEYADQCEFRMLWRVAEGAPHYEPIILNCPVVKKFCRLMP